jgi:hypothetical protein
MMQLLMPRRRGQFQRESRLTPLVAVAPLSD